MKQKAQTILIGLLLCVIGVSKSYAFDFSSVCETGQTLYYNITNAEYHYVELTCPSSNWEGYEKPTGDIIIPKYVYDGNDDIYFVTSIGDLAFATCYGLTGALTIPNYVTTIGDYAFANCEGFNGNLTIPNSVTSIGDLAFMFCGGLTGSLTIPNSVTTIGVAAFYGCVGLTSIFISASVTSIMEEPFINCSGLEQIVVDSGNLFYDSRNDCNAIVETNTNTLLTGCKNTIIPNSIISIADCAFSCCIGLTSIIIPSSVTSIGSSAFSGCSGLTSIIIPDSVTSIGSHAFETCTGLLSVTIGNSVTSIGNRAFYYCNGIEQIIVEPENTVYDSRVNCNAIIETNTNKLIVGCKNTVIPNSVTTIYDDAFAYCSGLTSISIPNSVTSIGATAFFSCSGLTALIIPNSVTSVGNSAFGYCSGLTSVYIGNSITSFLNGFYSCNNLSSVYIFATAPPTLLGSTFSDTSNLLKIYVPYESLDAYKTATTWSNYESSIFPMVYRVVPGYGEGQGNYCFIASPLVGSTNPTEVENMITETEYDLYRFDQSENDEWQNYKAYPDGFNLVNGQGYLYANKEDVNLVFTGNFNENSTKTIHLIYESDASFAGWNLVGNPFPLEATVTGSSYYVMNAEGTQIDPIAVSSGETIAPCTGIMVQVTVLGQPITFTRESRQVSTNGNLQIAVVQNGLRGNAVQDKAIISFNEGDELGKIVFNKDNAILYIPQGDEDYAIAYAEKQGEMPLNFEANVNGNYTITINPENVEMDYLHLVDNMTGTDVDLLATPSYTFESKISDYASRFRLVFSAIGDTNNEEEEPFAFVSNGNIIVTGDYADATLQIVDMLGHVVVSMGVARSVSTNGIASGVYVLQLINGNDVKTQKIVIR